MFSFLFLVNVHWMSWSVFRSCWVQISAKRLAIIFRVEWGKWVGYFGWHETGLQNRMLYQIQEWGRRDSAPGCPVKAMDSEKISYIRIKGRGTMRIDFVFLCLFYPSSLACSGYFLSPIPNSGLPIILFSMTYLSCITYSFSSMAHFHPEDGDSSMFIDISKTVGNFIPGYTLA